MKHKSLSLTVLAMNGVPLVKANDDLAALIATSLRENEVTLETGDVVVLAQKIVSKAEGRLVSLDHITPSTEAVQLARTTRKDPRIVELVLTESQQVMRAKPDVLIVRHRLGLVMANAGIDQSNVDHTEGACALLLPLDPDGSCRKIRTALRSLLGVDVSVLIIDSLGRAWRNGTTGTAIGLAGMAGLVDLRGQTDIHGRRLETSELGLADEVAAAASLIMGQASEGRPIAIVRGVPYLRKDGRAADLIRTAEKDLFP